jgi:predicted PurR-regulated permease PerM
MNEGERNINITISAGTIFKAIVIVLLVVLLFAVKDLVLVVLTSIVLASSIEPLIIWMRKWKVRRVPAVIITYLILALSFSGILYFFIPPLVADTSSFFGAVPKYIDTISLWNPLQEDLTAQKTLATSFSQGLAQGTQAVEKFTTNQFSIKDFFDNLSKAFSNVSEGVIQLIGAVFGGILSFVLIIVLSFYLAVQENGIGNFLQVIIPKKYEEYTVSLWKRVELKIGYWIQGQLLLGLLVGVLVYLSLIVVGIKNALVLAVIAAAFEIIPLFGPILAAIPAIAIALGDSGMTLALVVAGCYVIIHQFENHLFYPLVVKKIIGVPPIIVILALIVGAKLAGFLGLVLSVPVAATLMEYFKDLEKLKLAKNSS